MFGDVAYAFGCLWSQHQITKFRDLRTPQDKIERSSGTLLSCLGETSPKIKHEGRSSSLPFFPISVSGHKLTLKSLIGLRHFTTRRLLPFSRSLHHRPIKEEFLLRSRGCSSHPARNLLKTVYSNPFPYSSCDSWQRPQEHTY
jgi:hypothetical protein